MGGIFFVILYVIIVLKVFGYARASCAHFVHLRID